MSWPTAVVIATIIVCVTLLLLGLMMMAAFGHDAR